MQAPDLIVTITVGLLAALAFGYLTHRLGWSPIVGYLLAGIAIGPHTPGPVADAAIAEQLAEFGVVLLMFGVGLQFHVEELLAVRRVALPGALVQTAIATGLGMAVAGAFGIGWASGAVFGIALSIASTVVVVRVLADNRELHTRTGHIAVGWLVMQDLIAVTALVLLPVLSRGNASGAELAAAVALTALKVAGLVVFTLLVGRAIPRILDHVAATRSRELFTLTVLVLALGIALGAAVVFGVSMALGAFLAGIIVGRSEYSLRAASEALPMRDAFAVLFFVSVGMLLDPRHLLDAPGTIAATMAVVMVANPLVAFATVRALRHPRRIALGVAVALAQIGEFSFIITRLGQDLGLLTAATMQTVVSASIASILLNPLLYRALALLERRRARTGPVAEGDAAEIARPAHPAHADPAHRAVVVGYGPTGRTLTRLLGENGVESTVIELNMDTVRALRQQGIAAVYGDAAHLPTLRAAGAHAAGHLVLTASLPHAREVIRLARELNPRIRVLARTTHLRDRDALRRAGADIVYSGEGEVALALVEAVLHRLGATAEQIDRERARAHSELFES
ncbi:MAG TPA: cation:proton antiporter [Vicinamibacterales bacterium]|nr:cation:proton antiporter [Vicinamibacterales bacterium]